MLTARQASQTAAWTTTSTWREHLGRGKSSAVRPEVVPTLHDPHGKNGRDANPADPGSAMPPPGATPGPRPHRVGHFRQGGGNTSGVACGAVPSAGHGWVRCAAVVGMSFVRPVACARLTAGGASTLPHRG